MKRSISFAAVGVRKVLKTMLSKCSIGRAFREHLVHALREVRDGRSVRRIGDAVLVLVGVGDEIVELVEAELARRAELPKPCAAGSSPAGGARRLCGIKRLGAWSSRVTSGCCFVIGERSTANQASAITFCRLELCTLPSVVQRLRRTTPGCSPNVRLQPGCSPGGRLVVQIP
jgi:hypothetical protein